MEKRVKLAWAYTLHSFYREDQTKMLTQENRTITNTQTKNHSFYKVELKEDKNKNAK